MSRKTFDSTFSVFQDETQIFQMWNFVQGRKIHVEATEMRESEQFKQGREKSSRQG